MENARDTFYVTLRNRLATLNPARTLVLRGVVRPGILVAENELATLAQPTDVFCLRWTGVQVETTGALPLATLECTITYATDGSAGNGGMDRGRLLAAMDGELAGALCGTLDGTQGGAPRRAVKTNYTGLETGAGAVALQTNVFWGDVVFGEVVVQGERIGRTAKVAVFSYQEAGEL